MTLAQMINELNYLLIKELYISFHGKKQWRNLIGRKGGDCGGHARGGLIKEWCWWKILIV